MTTIEAEMHAAYIDRADKIRSSYDHLFRLLIDSRKTINELRQLIDEDNPGNLSPLDDIEPLVRIALGMVSVETSNWDAYTFNRKNR